MNLDLETKLQTLGLELPALSTPGGKYQSLNIRNKIAYVAIQFPIQNDTYLYKGKLGKKLSTKDGYNALQIAALNVISQVHHKVGFENVIGLNHIDIYFRSTKEWDESPIISDGASSLFNTILGEKGKHSRAIFGVQRLPRKFSVGLTSTFSLKS